MMDKLLPCPFCGSAGAIMPRKTCGLRVVCQNINCQAERAPWQDQTEFAIKAWNTRKEAGHG